MRYLATNFWKTHTTRKLEVISMRAQLFCDITDIKEALQMEYIVKQGHDEVQSSFGQAPRETLSIGEFETKNSKQLAKLQLEEGLKKKETKGGAYADAAIDINENKKPRHKCSHLVEFVVKNAV